MRYSNFVKNITFPLIARRDGLSGIGMHLHNLNKSQYWPKDRIIEFQLQKVKMLLIHAYTNTQFYKEVFDQAGFNPADLNYLDELEKLPVLTKKDLQGRLHTLLASNIKKTELHQDATGGSTGNHTPFFRDNKCLAFKKAIEFRCNSWSGWDVGHKIAYYWPAIQDFAKEERLRTKIKNFFSYRALMLYSGKLDEETLHNHYNLLAQFQPSLMRAFPNPLTLLAKYIKQTNKPKICIPSIISVGEPLLKSQRRLFTETFGAKVFNCYVSRECGNIACECGEIANHLHINSEMLFIEFIKDDKHVNQGPKKILLTDLVNYGMPFIRYKIEDLGVPVKDECRCGRGLPLMRMDAGRASDFLISPYDRSLVSGCSFLHYLIAEGPEVGQIQVIQDRMDHLILKIVKNKNYSREKLLYFDQIINKMFKGQMKYDIHFVDSIESEPSGKYLFTKCFVATDIS